MIADLKENQQGTRIMVLFEADFNKGWCKFLYNSSH